jgi:hypothetical protein
MRAKLFNYYVNIDKKETKIRSSPTFSTISFTALVNAAFPTACTDAEYNCPSVVAMPCGVWIGLTTNNPSDAGNDFMWIDGTPYLLNNFAPGERFNHQ